MSKKLKTTVIKWVIIAILLVAFIGAAYVAMEAIGAKVNKDNLNKFISSLGKIDYSSNPEGTQLVPEKDQFGYYTIRSDRNIKVLQLSNIFIGGSVYSSKADKEAVNTIYSIINTTKPDFVVVTSNVIYSTGFKGYGDAIKSLDVVANIFEGLGVYWTITFGDKDTSKKYSTQKLSDHLLQAKYKYCIYEPASVVTSGIGNQVVLLKSATGAKISQALVMLDSSKGYIAEDQITWYEEEINKIRRIYSGSIVGSLTYPLNTVFTYTPVEEYQIAWDAFKESKYTENGTNYKYINGVCGAGEKIKCDTSSKFFDTFAKYKGQAIFAGNNVDNFFAMDYTKNIDGEDYTIRLSSNMSIDYLVNKNFSKGSYGRGATLIEITKSGDFVSNPVPVDSQAYLGYVNKFFSDRGGKTIDLGN